MNLAIKKLGRIMEWGGAIAIAFMAAHVVLDVFTTYVFNKPIPGTLEVVNKNIFPSEQECLSIGNDGYSTVLVKKMRHMKRDHLKFDAWYGWHESKLGANPGFFLII